MSTVIAEPNRQQKREQARELKRLAKQGAVDLSQKKVPVIAFGYVYPSDPPLIHESFMRSCMSLAAGAATLQHGVRPVSVGTNGLLAKARNTIVSTVLADPSNRYLLFSDTDTEWVWPHVKMLLEADKPIVAALYFSFRLTPEGERATFPVALRADPENPGGYEPLTEADLLDEEGDLLAEPIEVDGVGMGLTLIKREVLEALDPQGRRLWPFAETNEERGYGEDLTFSLRAKEAGFQPYLLPAARIGHHKSVVL